MNQWTKFALLFGLTAACCFAQDTSVGLTARAVAREVVADSKWIGVILLSFGGLAIALGGSHIVGKIGGLLVGLALAMFSIPMVTWLASLAPSQ